MINGYVVSIISAILAIISLTLAISMYGWWFALILILFYVSIKLDVVLSVKSAIFELVQISVTEYEEENEN